MRDYYISSYCGQNFCPLWTVSMLTARSSEINDFINRRHLRHENALLVLSSGNLNALTMLSQKGKLYCTFVYCDSSIYLRIKCNLFL